MPVLHTRPSAPRLGRGSNEERKTCWFGAGQDLESADRAPPVLAGWRSGTPACGAAARRRVPADASFGIRQRTFSCQADLGIRARQELGEHRRECHGGSGAADHRSRHMDRR